MVTLGIVADDLTGATTTGALLAHAGGKPIVLFDDRDASRTWPDEAQILVLSTDSRASAPEVAFSRVHLATQYLIGLGASYFSKRIDTTCRGNIGPEVEGMLAALGDDYVAVLVPAMPASRRIVVEGYSIIDSTLLADTGAAQDLHTPVHESHLPTLFSQQFRRDVAHVPLSVVLHGSDTIAERLSSKREAGATAFVVDAVSAQHVEEIARAVTALGWKAVAVDPGPFSLHLAVNSGIVKSRPREEAALRSQPSPSDSGMVAVIAGSATQTTHEQMARLAEEPGTHVFVADVLALLGTSDVFEHEALRVVRDVRAMLSEPERPRVALLALDTVMTGLSTSTVDLEHHSGMTGAAISTLLLHRFADLARRFLDELGAARLTGLYLTGGDVMACTCHALGASGLRLLDYVIPQVDLAEIVGGPFEGIRTVCKGGLTGDQSTAVHAVNRLFDEMKG